MEIKQQITLTEKETLILHEVIDKLAEIHCISVRCIYCPLNVHTVDSHSCLILVISDILRKYGYKVTDNE